MTDPCVGLAVSDAGFDGATPTLVAEVFPAPAVTDRADRAVARDRGRGPVWPAAGCAGVQLVWPTALTQRLPVDTVGDHSEDTAACARVSVRGIARLASVTHDAVAFAERWLAYLSAPRTHFEMGVAVTATADTGAFLAVGQRALLPAPVAAHALHARIFGSQDIEQSA